MQPSGKLVLREEEFKPVTAQRSLCPVSEAYSVFCYSALPWITLTRNLKQAYHAHCGVLLRKFGVGSRKEALSAQIRKFHSKYVCVFIH